jgi:hypothetical protein
MAQCAHPPVQLSLLDQRRPAAAAPTRGARLDDVADLLVQHAAWAARLAGGLARLEQSWVDFAATTQAAFIPASLGVIERLDKLRGRLITEELHRATDLLCQIQQPPVRRVSLSVRDEGRAALVLAPPPRRGKEAS